MQNILIAVVLVVIALILAPVVFTQAHAVQVNQLTDTQGITTAAVTTAPFVLDVPGHFHLNSVQHMTVTSADPDDTPVAGSYVSSTRTATITGLAENTTRNLTVGYETDALADYPGASAIMGLLPLIYIVGVLGMAVGIIWKTFA